jgi:hypothetical protein
MGAATNIVTDLIYTFAPLVYISRVQLNKRTVWGVRIVFLLGLMYAVSCARSDPLLTFYQHNNNLCTQAVRDEVTQQLSRPYI